MESLKKFNLREGEKLILSVRHHPIIVVPHLIVTFFILVLDFFLMFYLFMQGLWGAIMFFAIIAVVLFYVFRLFFLYRRNKFIVTSMRLVDVEQVGFFEHYISEYSLTQVKNVEIIKKGLSSFLFRHGNVKISFKDDIAPLELFKIEKPNELFEKLNGYTAANQELRRESEKNAQIQGLDDEIRHLSRAQKAELVKKISEELAEDRHE